MLSCIAYIVYKNRSLAMRQRKSKEQVGKLPYSDIQSNEAVH